jgi:hypothetical protein
MIKDSESFKVLKNDMYGLFKLPEAPQRSDKTDNANNARAQRKFIKSKVYTYIDRMGDYYMRRME